MASWSLNGGALLRTLRRASLFGLMMLFVLFASVQFEQRLLRHRAERLLTDIRTIRVDESRWSDAQALMKRWGAWGHSSGSCTVAHCEYSISLADVSSNVLSDMSAKTKEVLSRFAIFAAYGHVLRLLGGRTAILSFDFRVRNGLIVWDKTDLMVEATGWIGGNWTDGVLWVTATSQQTLSTGMWSYGQLAQHPNYRVGHHNGSVNALMANLQFTPQISASEFSHITDFDLSCMTRYCSCMILEQLLPATREWQLYEYPWGETHMDANASDPPYKPCDIPVWALGRDASVAYVVDSLASVREKDPQDGWGVREADTVRVAETLRGPTPWANGTAVTAYPSTDPKWDSDGMFGPEVYEHLPAGHRAIVVSQHMPETGKTKLDLNRCGVLEDTPEVRRQLQQGFAMHDASERADPGRVDPHPPA